MADPDAPSPDPDSVDAPEPAPPGAPDPILQMLVHIVNKTTAGIRKAEPDWNIQRSGGASMGITLVVGGVVISGSLVSGQEYFTKVGDGIRQGTASEGSEWMLDLLGGTFETFASQFDDVLGEDGGDLTLPSAIHLKDARIHVPGGDWLPQGGMWWRGRIDHVDGFTLGTFSGT